MAKSPADHNKYAKMGYTHDKPDMNELSMSMKDLSKTGLNKHASGVDKDKLKKGIEAMKKAGNAKADAETKERQNEDHAGARMYRDNPEMMKQQGPGGFKSLDPKMKKTIKKIMKKLPPKPTKEETAKRVVEAYKVGQTVKPTKGPHAGQDHEVIHVHGDGSYNIKPKNMPSSRIRYRQGAARAKHDELNEISKDKLFNYMRKSAADVSKARGDARRQDKRIGGQKKADDKIRAMQGKRDASHIKVPATEGKARDRLMAIVNKASGRTDADRQADAKKAAERRKEADKDLADFRKKSGMS